MSHPLSQGLADINHIQRRYKRIFYKLLNFAAAHAVTFSSVPCHNELGCTLVNIPISCLHFEHSFLPLVRFLVVVFLLCVLKLVGKKKFDIQ